MASRLYGMLGLSSMNDPGIAFLVHRLSES